MIEISLIVTDIDEDAFIAFITGSDELRMARARSFNNDLVIYSYPCFNNFPVFNYSHQI